MAEQTDQLILKFLAGVSTREEQETLEVWTSQSPENKKMLAELKKIWDESHAHPSPDFNSQEEWIKLQAKLRETDTVRIPHYRLLYKIAASLIFLVAASVILYQTFFKIDLITIQSADASRHVSLPDGTIVWLNKQSQLTYLPDFREIRNVELSGEAFFEVTHDASKPFVISTGESKVRVLGTSFNVRAYQTDSLQEVYVASGKVRVTSANDSIELIPGDLGMLNKRHFKLVSTHPSDENSLAWKTGRLVFQKTSLREVVHTLENYFQIAVTIKNPALEKCRFTSSFNNPTLEEVIEAISLSMNLNVVHQDKKYVFDGEGCEKEDL